MSAFREQLPRREADFKLPSPVKVVLSKVCPADFEPILREHITRPYQLHDEHSQEAWRQLPEIPSGREMNPDSSNGPTHPETLPENITEGPWGSKDAYIGSQYQLLRYDATYPLRDSIRFYKENPGTSDLPTTSIYTNVFIVGYTFANMGAAARIEFSTERAGKRIRWPQSSRLQQGTMVALSPAGDKFRTICTVAIVAARPLAAVEQDPPQIDIFWASTEEAEFDPTEEYVMVEAKSGYFEASRHMLVAMQKLMSETFPMAEHLIEMRRTVGPPMDVEEQPCMNLSALLPSDAARETVTTGDSDEDVLQDVDILGRWPTLKSSPLDASQMAAVRRILGKKVAIIQGPPGTGKTFVSITALKIMLNNWKVGDPPILVSAQTNHAIDQLLNLIEPFEPNFLRLGGRSSESNEIIQSRTLYRLRSQLPSGVSGSAFKTRIAQETLRTISEEIIHDIKDMNDQGAEEAGVFLKLDLITQEQYDSLNDDEWVDAGAHVGGLLYCWLGLDQQLPPKRCPISNNGFEDDEDEDDYEYETLNEAELEARKSKDEDDVEALKGPYVEYRRAFIGRNTRTRSNIQVEAILRTTTNLWDIDEEDRGAVYQYLKNAATKKYLASFRQRLTDYSRGINSLKIARWQGDATFIRKTGIKLIGCTTTGLSKYRGLLACLKPRTLLVEEAAETLEGTILAAMFESLDHLILVGDHQQLQAHCNVSHLERHPYNLSVSLFERLVNNGVEFTMLNKQRRMISDLRKLMSPLYEGLEDHPSVLDRRVRQPIPGMGGRDSYCFHHTWLESRDDAQSTYNVEEASMIVAFFNYLVLNGIEASKITVLTFYNGQRKRLLKLLRRVPNLADRGPFNVFTVDSYQGEENDVVLLSLVRSNTHGNIGFLENKNRAVVALSRARRGMYIFGNCINLLRSGAESYNFWFSVMMTMKSQGRFDISFGFPIVCSTHSTETMIESAVELENLSGGCGVKCNGVMPCGHKCRYTCHSFPHEDLICKEPCTKPINCIAAHSCNMRCSDPCACPCEQGGHNDDSSLPVSHLATGGSITQSTLMASFSNPALYPAVHSLEAELSENQAAWRVWEAPKPTNKGDQSTKPSPRKSPLIRDSHRPVNLSNGARQIGPSNAAIFHKRPYISGQMEQKQSPSGPFQSVPNSPEGFVRQLDDSVFPAPPNSNRNIDRHSKGPLHLLPPLAIDGPNSIDDSTNVIRSAETNSQTYNDGQATKKSSSRSQLVFKSGRSYSGPPPPTDNIEPVSSPQVATTSEPVSTTPTRLFVSGIVEADSSASLKYLFAQFGTVLDAVAMNDTSRVTSGHPRRFGFVTMASSGHADVAIARLHGTRRNGQTLTIQEAKPDPNSSNCGPNNQQKHSVPASKSKENNPGSGSPLKKNTPELNTQSAEFDQILKKLNLSPNDANVEHALRKNCQPSDNNRDGVITIDAGKQKEIPIQEDDLISFD
ncbi:hypothetical protein VE03_00209 [Pseudogymnoascus sp. 23342-1-I1]|nr:hypothetical protein VE03_00209 [Pseudogymnoascus sp. 23342-1-I1]